MSSPCVIWVDYSVARTGGRTVQQVMASLAQKGLVQHRSSLMLGGITGFRHQSAEWTKLLQVLSKPCVELTGRTLRAAVQVTDGDAAEFWSRWLPAVRALRAQKNPCCRIILTTRVRQPVSHYLSAYVWATSGKCNLGNQLSRPHTVLRNGRSYAVLPKPSFTEWAPASLQASLFVHGGSSRYVTDEQSGRLTEKRTTASRAGLEQLLRFLSDDVDIVYDLDHHFDAALAQIAARLGFSANESALQYERISPRVKMYGGGPVGEQRERSVAEACPNMSACIEHVHRVAPLDMQLHKHALDLFSTRGSAWPAPMATYEQRPSVQLASGYSPRCAPARLRELHTPARHLLPLHSRTLCRAVKASTAHLRSALNVSAAEAALARFTGACTRSVAVESMHEAVDDQSHAARGLAPPRAPGAEAARAPAGDVPCALVGDVVSYSDPSNAACDEIRVVFYFAPPPPPGAPPRRVALPRIARSVCNVAIVDNTTLFERATATIATAATTRSAAGGSTASDGVSSEADGWRLRRLARWPFAMDAPRTAHYLKVIAPLLFPRARVVLAGDAKCQGRDGGLPCALMRPTEGVELSVAKNRWFKSSSVEGEFVRTWKHMRARKMGAATFREITAQLDAYEREGYEMDALHRMPDTFCMAWRAQTAASRAFACRLGYEVATRSMREQLSFDHARPPELNISWWPMKIISQHGNEACVGRDGEHNVSVASEATGDRGATTVVTTTVVSTTPDVRSAGHSDWRQHATPGPDPLATAPLVDAAATGTIKHNDLPVGLERWTARAHAARLAWGSIRRSTAPLAMGPASVQPARRPPPPVLRHAVCVTGLRRAFGEIGRSVGERVFGLLKATATRVELRVFGVQPPGDDWAAVHAHLGPLAAVEAQAPCRAPGAPLPAFFTCTRGRVTHRLDSCTASFVQMQCDLAHCDAMIGRYERSRVAARSVADQAQPFDYVTWMRLDVAWELAVLAPPLPLPALPANRPDAIWLPQMNSQRAGLCDKFAFGTRRAMQFYLNRVDLVDDDYGRVSRDKSGSAAAWSCRDVAGQQVCNPKPFADSSGRCTKRSGCMLSMSSERFLSYALYRANLTVVRMPPWIFCKFGNSTHSWSGCTARLRARRSCTSLRCPSWMSGGCTCSNTTCAQNQWYCTNVSHGASGAGGTDL